MSAVAGMIRSRAQMEKALEETSEDVKNFEKKVCTPSVSQLPMFYKLYDMLLSQKVYLFAMLDYAKQEEQAGVLHYIQIRKVNFRDLKAVNLLENFTVVS